MKFRSRGSNNGAPHMAVPPQAAHPQQYKVKSGKKKVITILTVILLALVAVVAFVAVRSTGSFQRNTVDLTKQIMTPEILGLDGAGEVTEDSIQWNEDGLRRAILEATEGESAQDSEEDSLDVSPIMEAFRLSIDKTEELSNGDEVTVTIQYRDQQAFEDQYGVKFFGKDRTFPVSGLTDLVERSPFEELKFELDGISPYVSLKPTSMSGAVAQLFGMSNYDLFVNGEPLDNQFVKIGDEILIQFNEDGVEKWKSEGIQPSETEYRKTISSEDVLSYVTEISELDQESISYIESESDDLLKQTVSRNGGGTFDYVGYSFIRPKDNKWDNKNSMVPELLRVYKVTMDGRDSQRYAVVEVTGLINAKSESGESAKKQDIDSFEFDVSTNSESVEEVIREWVDSRAASFEVESTSLD